MPSSSEFELTGSAPQGRRARTKARNRESILAAARAIFSENGFDGASVRDIVRASNLSVGTFYQYFPDKQAVFLAVAGEAVESIRGRLRAVRRDPTLAFEERMYRAYLAYFEFTTHERKLWEVIDRGLPVLTGKSPSAMVRQGLDDLLEDLAPDLANSELGQKHPRWVAAAMIGAGVLVAYDMSRSAVDPKEAARFCTEFSLNGLSRPALAD